MGGIPLPALQIHQQPDMMEQFGKAMQLKQLMAAGQMQQIQLKQAQQDADDREKLNTLFKQNGGDWDKTLAAAPGAGVSLNAIAAQQVQHTAMQAKAAALTKDQLENLSKQHDNTLGLLEATKEAPPEQKAVIYGQGRQQIMANPQAYGVTDASHVPPEQYPGDDWIDQQIAVHQGGKLLFDQQMKRREVAAQEVAAQARQTQANAAAAKSAPLAPPVIATKNQQLLDRIHVLDPNAQAPPEWQLQPGATEKDYADIDKALEQVEKAQGTKATHDLAVATAGAARGNARSDKSYQFNSAQLEKVAQPIDQAVQRLGRLKDTIAQNSPQAMALEAPELLTVMAGGAGSGLRMNEAEISRIIGGRSKWQSLEASLNQWRLDPSKAASITPEQQGQIKALVDVVDKKLTAKQQAIDQGRQALINTDDPGQHRKIVANTRSAMTSIDAGATSGGGASKGPQVGAIEDGYRFKGGDASKPENWEKVK